MMGWLKAGDPPHWQYLAAGLMAALLILERILPHTKWVKANSTIELVFNVLKPVLGPIPVVGWAISLLATPAPPPPIHVPPDLPPPEKDGAP